MGGFLFSAIPIAFIDHYVSISPVVAIVKIFAEGARSVMQAIGLTLLTYFTDLPSSIGKLIANVPKGTVIPNIECVSYDNFLRSKNVKDAVTGNGDPVWSDGRGNITWLSSPKAKLYEYMNPSINGSTGGGYKDYLWYLVYSIGILFLGFCFLVYSGWPAAPDSGPDFNAGPNLNGNDGSEHEDEGSEHENTRSAGEGSSKPAKTIGFIITSFFRGSAKIKSWFKSFFGSEPAESGSRPPYKPLSDESLADMSHYFKNVSNRILTKRNYVNDEARAAQMLEMDWAMKYVPGNIVKTNPETGVKDCYLLINGQEKLFWSSDNNDNRSFFLNPATEEEFAFPMVAKTWIVNEDSIGPSSVITGDRPDSPRATHNQLGGGRVPKASFTDDEGNSIEYIKAKPLYDDVAATAAEDSSAWSDNSPTPKASKSISSDDEVLASTSNILAGLDTKDNNNDSDDNNDPETFFG